MARAGLAHGRRWRVGPASDGIDEDPADVRHAGREDVSAIGRLGPRYQSVALGAHRLLLVLDFGIAGLKESVNRVCLQRREPASGTSRLSDVRQGVRLEPRRWRPVETELACWQRRGVAPVWP